MAAAASGRGTLGIPKSVGAEFLHADKGRKFADGGAVQVPLNEIRVQDPDRLSLSNLIKRLSAGSGEDVYDPRAAAQVDRERAGRDAYVPPSERKNKEVSFALGGLVHYDDGGEVDYSAADTARMQNPQYRQQYERYAGMTPEKLQELAVMIGPGSPQGQIVNSLLQKRRMSPPATLQGFDAGGVMGMGEAMPWWARRQSNQVDANKSGFLKSTIPGRTDHIPTQAPAGSYVVPADVVSGLGEGNSLAGAKIMQEILRSGPWGTPQSHLAGHKGPPPAPQGNVDQQAKGGKVGAPTKILAAGGEHLIHPDDVRRIGGGNLGRGHKVLDKWVVHERKKIAKKMLSLPGPKK